MEIYSIRIREDLVGRTFGELVQKIKIEANGTLIALAKVKPGSITERSTFDRQGRLQIRRLLEECEGREGLDGGMATEESSLGVTCNPGPE